MRVTLLAVGSRGDVQPLLALAVGLERTGRHRVQFAAPDDFAPLAREHGVPMLGLGVDARNLIGGNESGAGSVAGRSTLLWVRQAWRSMRPLMDQIAQRTLRACQDADVIIFSTMGFSAYHIAERLGIPRLWALPFPAMATDAFPSPAFPQLPLGKVFPLRRTYNRLTHLVTNRLLQALVSRYTNAWRQQELGLPPIWPDEWSGRGLQRLPTPVLYSYSPAVLPKPPEWGDHVHVTGYWPLDPPPYWQPPRDLVDFVESGPPPVYVGFGSMALSGPEQMTSLVCQALRRAGQRGVLVSGWGALRDLTMNERPDGVYALDTVPYSWLFPRAAAVVHHGGSGTTGDGLRAGVPSVLVPHTGDQPFWGRRVKELGVGPRPIPRRQLTVDRLAGRILRAVTDRKMRVRAAALGERLRRENGVARAIDVIERVGLGQ